MKSPLFDAATSGAQLSPDDLYRYLLWRTWDNRPPLVFVLLNPSTADAAQDDQTVRRCKSIALANGAGGLRICNLFALRATDPAQLYLDRDPIGSNNDCAICEAVRGAAMVICGWGRHGDHLGRAGQVLALLAQQAVPLHCMRCNADGSPSHPLYLPKNLAPVPYSAAIAAALAAPQPQRGAYAH